MRTHLNTFDTFRSKLVLVALCAINLVFLGYKRFCSNWVRASATDKTFFVPLPGLILHLLHTCLNGDTNTCKRFF